MKCVQDKTTKTILRVDDNLAHRKVIHQNCQYVPKRMWKEQVRKVKP